MSRPLLRVLRGGLMTTVQDCGRLGYGHWGVPTAGAMDLLSHRLANRLVGNPDTAAALEMTLVGDDFEFLTDAVVAVCGAHMRAQLEGRDGQCGNFPLQRPVFVRRGTVLRFGAAVRGCRAVLAVAGGIDVPEMLGSRSTLLRGGWGGFEGRRLVAGDCLAACELTKDAALPWLPSADKQAAWSIRLQSLPNDAPTILRFVAGTHWEQLSANSRALLQGQNFVIRPESDRMGYRLRGSELALEQEGSEQGRLKSAAVVPGTLQLPADGQLLLLMADCAPTGGYPRIGHVISADLSLAGQLRPGDALRLVQVTHAEALEALRVQERALRSAMVMSRL